MEDPLAPRTSAVTFAILALLVRLVAAQSGVFSLWFCRRCYERSRGEMITMLCVLSECCCNIDIS